MKEYLTPNDLKKIEDVKGEILLESQKINLVVRNAEKIGSGLKVYTVWNYEENFIFINTCNKELAIETFKKYTK